MEEQASTIHPDLHVGTYLEIMVSDIGHGMAPDVMERIFEPYFTAKGEGEGTGLGLAVIHGTVKGHSGAITVETAVGKGSKFHVFLHIHEPSAPTAEVKELVTFPKKKSASFSSMTSSPCGNREGNVQSTRI
jgi:signal transduction histidine kinase